MTTTESKMLTTILRLAKEGKEPQLKYIKNRDEYKILTTKTVVVQNITND